MKLISLTIAAVIALGGPAWAKDGHVLVKPHRHHLGLMPIKRAVYKDQADCTVVLQDGGTLSKALVHGQVCAVPGASHVSITWNEIHDPMAFTALVAAPQPLSKTGFAGLAAPQTTIGNLIKNGLVGTVISDLQTIDTVANVVNPASTLPAPYNTFLPEAHQCVAIAVPFLQGLPSLQAIPKPTGPGGVFTAIGMAQIKLNAVQGFLSTLSTTSLLPLKRGCAAWAQDIVLAPSEITANVSADTINFITMFRSLQ